MREFDEVAAVRSEGKLRLIHSTVYGGLEDPVSPRTAYRRYPELFLTLFQEMQKIIVAEVDRDDKNRK